MKNKLILLVLSLLLVTTSAVPGVASAGEPVVDPASGKFPLTATGTGGQGELRVANEPGITCTSDSGSGKLTTGTTGELSLTFKGCTTSFFGFPVSCNSSGGASGEIRTNSFVVHSTYLTDAKTTPGVLGTPPTGGVFATIICGSFATIEIKGNGIIGHLESPKCGEKRTTATLNFSATGSSQTYKQVTGTGTAFNLKSRTESNGTEAEAAIVCVSVITFSEAVTLTCV